MFWRKRPSNFKWVFECLSHKFNPTVFLPFTYIFTISLTTYIHRVIRKMNTSTRWLVNLFFKIFTYLAVLGLSCGTWDLWSLLWDPVPWPGIKPKPPCTGVWSLSRWTTRKVPGKLRPVVYLAPRMLSSPLGLVWGMQDTWQLLLP